MSFAGVDINSYRSRSTSKPAKKSHMPINSEYKDSESIRAWRNGNLSSSATVKQNDRSTGTKLASKVDRLLSSNKLTDDKLKESSISNRVYRSELAREEAEAKLAEWMKVASELQQVVREQQHQLITSNTKSDRSPPSSNTNSNVEPHPNSHIAQLQQLVHNVRSELGKATTTSTAATSKNNRPSSAGSSHSDSDTSKLHSEIQSLRQQVHQLQHLHRQQSTIDLNTPSHNSNNNILSSSLSMADHNRTRNALMDAEMDLQKATAEIATLRQRLVEGEAAQHVQETQVASLLSEIERAKQSIENKETEILAVKREKAEALSKINEAASEISNLQTMCSQKDARMQAAMHSAQQAAHELTEAQCKATAAEASEAMERSRRGNLEASMAKLQSEVLTLESELAEMTRRNASEGAAYAAHLEAFNEEIARCQQDTRASRRDAESAREQLETLHRAHAQAVAQAKSAQERLREAEAEKEAVLRRAVHAENEAAAAIASSAERDTAEEAERMLRHETEIRGLKEVLDRVAASAQAKDAALEQVKAQWNAEKASWGVERSNLVAHMQSAEHQLKLVQAAAADEARHWQEEVQRVMSESITTPLPVDEDALLASEREEHNAAVRALEEAHIAALEAAREEARQSEAASLREEVSVLNDRSVELQSRLRAAETELLTAQNKASQLNSAVEKLQTKCKRYKEELSKTKSKLSEVEETNQGLMERIEKTEEASAALKAELGDAQDEVEALLTARLQALSRPGSEIDPEEEEERRRADIDTVQNEPGFSHEMRGGVMMGGNAVHNNTNNNVHGVVHEEAYHHHQPQHQDYEDQHYNMRPHVEYVDTLRPETPREESTPLYKNKSPLKKLANLLRGKKSVPPTAADAMPHSNHARRTASGTVKQLLHRGPDGRIEWRPNELAEPEYNHHQEQWMENQIYANESFSQEDLEY